MQGLTQKELKKLFNYNPNTGLFVRKAALSARGQRYVGPNPGAVSPTGLIQIRIKKGKYYAHQLAFLYMTGKFPRGRVFHKNGNSQDNRWKNLREAIGVHYRKDCDRFEVRVHIDGMKKYIGLFATEEEATLAYQKAKKMAMKRTTRKR